MEGKILKNKMNGEVEKMMYVEREEFKGLFLCIIQNPSNLKGLKNCIGV